MVNLEPFGREPEPVLVPCLALEPPVPFCVTGVNFGISVSLRGKKKGLRDGSPEALRGPVEEEHGPKSHEPIR